MPHSELFSYFSAKWQQAAQRPATHPLSMTHRQACPHLVLLPSSRILHSQSSVPCPAFSPPSLTQPQLSLASFHSPLGSLCYFWEHFLQHPSLSSPLNRRCRISLVTSFKNILANSFLTTQLIISCELSSLLYSTETTQVYSPDHTGESPN